MYEFTTVVVKRSYSLISGQTSEDILTSTSGKYFNKNSFSSFSFLNLHKNEESQFQYFQIFHFLFFQLNC